jgi:hypothetical protein
MTPEALYGIGRKIQVGFNLPPLYGRKGIDELLDRIPTLEVIHQVVHGYACPCEDKVTAVNLRITRHDQRRTNG